MTPGDDTETSEAAHSARGRRAGKRSGRSSATTEEAELDPSGVLAALEAGVGEALPGLEILDRDLVFDQVGRADLAAVDALGRLVLVLVAGEDPDQAVLDALDLLAYARTNTSLLARHFGSRRSDPGLEPRVVVVDPACDERLAVRLGALSSAGVEVFGVRTLRSAAGERAYLVATGRESAAATGEGGIRAFLDALPLPLQEVGEELTQRMSRLDEELLATGDAGSLVWRLHGEVLARFACSGDHLTASVAPHHLPAAVRRSADVDGVLEEALARLVAELDPTGPPGARWVDRDDFEEADLPPRGSVSDGPILTDEEIRAFQA